MRETKKELRRAVDLLNAGKDESDRQKRMLIDEVGTLSKERDVLEKNGDALGATLADARDPWKITPWEVRIAALAVVLILEQHASVMATDVGAGVAEYQAAMQRAGELRRACAHPDAQALALDEKDAQALYEELTS